jgi:hypothetical protein
VKHSRKSIYFCKLFAFLESCLGGSVERVVLISPLKIAFKPLLALPVISAFMGDSYQDKHTPRSQHGSKGRFFGESVDEI